MKYILTLLGFILFSALLANAQEGMAHLHSNVKEVNGRMYNLYNGDTTLIKSYRDTYDKHENCTSSFCSHQRQYHMYFHSYGINHEVLITNDHQNFARIYDDQNRLITDVVYHHDKALEDSAVYSYHANGKMSKVLHYDSIGSLKETEEYNLHGDIVKDENTFSDDNVLRRQVNEYDGHFNIIKTESYKGDTLQYMSLYRYDEKNSMLESRRITFDPTERTLNRESYKYDSAGRLSENLSYVGDNNVPGKKIYACDKAGNRIMVKKFGTDTSSKYTSTVMHYNKLNKVICEDNYNDENKLTETKWPDKKGNDTLNISYKWIAGKRTPDKEIKRTRYNKDGDMISSTVHDGMGHELFSEACQYEYDKQGNWTKKMELVNNKVVMITEQKIEYY